MNEVFGLTIEDRFQLSYGLVVVGPATGACKAGDELELVDDTTVTPVRCAGVSIPRITDPDTLEHNRARNIKVVAIEGVTADDVRPGQLLRKRRRDSVPTAHSDIASKDLNS